MFRRPFLLLPIVCLVLLAVAPAGTSAQRAPLVAIQAGHWLSNEHADEFQRLRPSTGAHVGTVAEVDLNVDIAHRIAEYLRAWGNEAYVLPARVPPAYRADAFISIHSDGHANRNVRGYKVATYRRSWVATDTLVRELEDEYGRQTGLPKDWRITENMRNYYAFNSGLYEHTIAEDTPGAIIELGFLTNPTDRRFLLNSRDLVARAVALGIARFLGARPPEGWSAPPALPKGDIVEVINNRAPLYAGPGRELTLVDRAYRRERYAVEERRGTWAKLFSYEGTERWIEDFHTEQVFVPQP